MRTAPTALWLALAAGAHGAGLARVSARAPISYVLPLRQGQVAAARRFLQDEGARRTLAAGRPAEHAALLRDAYLLADLGDAAARSGGAAGALRQALLRRGNVFDGRDALVTRGLESAGVPEAARERALLEWPSLTRRERRWAGISLAEVRGAELDAPGALEEAWRRVPLKYRAWHLLRRGDEQSERAPSAVAQAFQRLRAAARYGSRDAVEQRYLEARLAAEKAEGRESEGSRLYLASRKQVSAAVRAVRDHLGEALAGTDAATLIDPGNPVKLGPTMDGAAHYQPLDDLVALGPSLVESFAKVSGRDPSLLASDEETRRLFALFAAPALVHEFTHRKQALDAARADVTLRGTRREEEEAFAAQALYVRQRLAASPGLAALVERWRSSDAWAGILWSPRYDGIPAILAQGYSDVPSAEVLGADVLNAALRTQAEVARQVPDPAPLARWTAAARRAPGRALRSEEEARKLQVARAVLRALSPEGLVPRRLARLQAMEARARATIDAASASPAP